LASRIVETSDIKHKGEGMKKTLIIFGIWIPLLLASAAHAQNPEAIVGKWWNQEKEAQIEIYACEGKYCGKIVWLKEPNYPASDPKGMGGKPRVDQQNPDPSKREGPLLGMNLLWGFTYSGGNLWEGGQIYDPREGKTYRCKMTLEMPDHLKVRGFIGISLIGKTNEWIRVK
jgi:uncharacterized protein (DUF2147 family)